MNKAKVRIVEYNADGIDIVAAAARLSTTPGSAADLIEDAYGCDNDKLIKKVVDLGHVTTVEHLVFNIAFDDVSAMFEQFLIEHRLAAYTVKSRRYVDYSYQGAYLPVLRMKDGSLGDIALNNKLAAMNDNLFNAYAQLIELGIPKEDARFVLPISLRSHIIMTVNARELMHMLYTMIQGRGSSYPEIRALGMSLYGQAITASPAIFDGCVDKDLGFEDKERLFEMLVADIPLNQKAKTPGPLVSVVTHTVNADRMLPLLAIMNHTGCTPDTAMTYLDDNPEAEKKAIHYLFQDKRKRELEQMNVTFRINTITLASLTHLTRHRVQNLLVPSFTEMGKSEDFIMPPSIAKIPEAVEIYEQGFRDAMTLCVELEDAGVVPEDLAYLIQAGNVTSVITTMNGRELIHFFKLRCCKRAQWEIQGIANVMLGACRKVAPVIFNNVGPACYMDKKCPEGKMSCGQIAIVDTQYK